MQVTSKSPVQLTFNRSGGCVITSRLDFWKASPDGWSLVGTNTFQEVTASDEDQQTRLPVGTYTVVAKYFVEESVNGVYAFEMKVGGTSIGAKSGDVNTTSSPSDSAAFRNQFILDVKNR